MLEAYYLQRAYAGGMRGAGAVDRAFEKQAIGLFDEYTKAESALLHAAVDLDKARVGSAPKLNAAKQALERRQRARDLARDAYLANFHARPTMKSWSGIDPVAAPQGRPTLPASDILIRYFVQDDVSFGVALAGTELEYFDLPKRPEVLRLVRSSLDALQSPVEQATDRPILSSLARLLPREFIRKHPDKTRLVIIPDDAVQPLPFAAINLAGPLQAYTPLIRYFEIVRTKSASHYYRQLSGTDGAALASSR